MTLWSREVPGGPRDRKEYRSRAQWRRRCRSSRDEPVGSRRASANSWRLSPRSCFERSPGAGAQSSPELAILLRTRHDDGVAVVDRAPLWLVAEWPENEPAPTKFTLAAVPRRMSRKQLVRDSRGGLAHRADVKTSRVGSASTTSKAARSRDGIIIRSRPSLSRRTAPVLSCQ